MVAVPEDEGEYPVVQFQHGTNLKNSDYKELISRVASWGFIVVAPQMYDGILPPLNAILEIENARAILNWLPTGLVPAMPELALARPNFEKIALVGHSRGGKVVFGVALNVSNGIIPQISAVAALDPVDGTSLFQIKPPILNYKNNSLDLGVPTLIVGTGLGPLPGPSRFGPFPPCAPEKYDHKYFFEDVSPPAFHFVAPNQGHMDFLNDCPTGFIGKLKAALQCYTCRGGSSRGPMRSFTGGILVAFLQNALFHNSSAFDAAYEHFQLAPIPLDPPGSKGKIGAVPTHQYGIL
jgi:chlorophyllase